MNKIVFGWLTFLLLPFTVIGGYKVIELIQLPLSIQVILIIFTIGIVVFNFIMACTLIVQGYNDKKLRTPFDNSRVNEKLLDDAGYKEVSGYRR